MSWRVYFAGIKTGVESAKTWVLAYLVAVDYERDLGGNVMFGTLTSSKGQTIVVLNIYGEG